MAETTDVQWIKTKCFYWLPVALNETFIYQTINFINVMKLYEFTYRNWKWFPQMVACVVSMKKILHSIASTHYITLRVEVEMVSEMTPTCLSLYDYLIWFLRTGFQVNFKIHKSLVSSRQTSLSFICILLQTSDGRLHPESFGKMVSLISRYLI